MQFFIFGNCTLIYSMFVVSDLNQLCYEVWTSKRKHLKYLLMTLPLQYVLVCTVCTYMLLAMCNGHRSGKFLSPDDIRFALASPASFLRQTRKDAISSPLSHSSSSFSPWCSFSPDLDWSLWLLLHVQSEVLSMYLWMQWPRVVLEWGAKRSWLDMRKMSRTQKLPKDRCSSCWSRSETDRISPKLSYIIVQTVHFTYLTPRFIFPQLLHSFARCWWSSNSFCTLSYVRKSRLSPGVHLVELYILYIYSVCEWNDIRMLFQSQSLCSKIFLGKKRMCFVSRLGSTKK